MKITKPEKLGFSSPRLARINTVMQRYVDEGKLAGISTLIARRGQVVHFEQFGMADIAAGHKMAADTIFRIYSMTKPITSVAVLMLMEEGHLRLSDPVADYLPAFNAVKVLDTSSSAGARLVEPHRPITICDLLTHTAGLSYGFEEHHHLDELYRKQVWGAMEANPELTLAEFVEALAKLPLAYHPGTRYRYSTATDVLGLLVQVVSGLPLADFFQTRILAPLGMKDTDFYVPADKYPRFAATYEPQPDGGIRAIDPARLRPLTRPTANPSGGGGLVSTSGDYLRFCQLLLNGGELDGERLLGRKTVELMTTNCLPHGVHLDNEPGNGAGFGLGVSILLDLGKVQQLGSVGNYGWGGAANTNFWIDPREELIGIIMLQFMPSDTYPVIVDFRNGVYQALVG